MDGGAISSIFAQYNTTTNVWTLMPGKNTPCILYRISHHTHNRHTYHNTTHYTHITHILYIIHHTSYIIHHTSYIIPDKLPRLDDWLQQALFVCL